MVDGVRGGDTSGDGRWEYQKEREERERNECEREPIGPVSV